MRRLAAVLLAAVICAAAFSGCSSVRKANKNESGKIDIVCTVFPAYDWVRNIIGGDNPEIEVSLLANGADMHSFQPSAEDMAKILKSGMFIYIGGSSDQWIRDFLKNNPSVNGVSLFDELKSELREEEIPEYMEAHGDEHGGELDEHIWLSLKMADKAVGAIAEKICELDKGNAEYRKNAELYRKEITKLDEEYAAAADKSENKTVIFADRFPFIYMMKDYGINYYAAFPGCSAESNASFNTILFLAQKADEYGKETLLVLENSNQSVLNAIEKNTKTKNKASAIMNSMQSVSADETQTGSYLEIMRENLGALVKALD